MICALAHPPAEIDVSVNTESIAYALTSLPIVSYNDGPDLRP